MSTTLQVAKTILDQLGGHRFIAMTGAKNSGGTATSLSFRLPSYFARNGINAIRITLEPSDTYRVEFSRCRATKFAPVSTHEGIYADALPALFSHETGLALAL